VGVDYHPRNKKIEPFLCNISGNDLLGRLHESFGLPLEEENTGRRKKFGFPARAPYNAKAADCRMWGAALANIPDEKFKAFITDDSYGWGGTPDEYVTSFVRRWQTFLETCSGYKGC
jgi:hypothetical protein